MRKYLQLALLAVLALGGSACHDIEEYPNSTTGNFEQLWTLVDEHYCFFAEKGIDWDSVHAVYAPQARRAQNTQQLFAVCANMLNELRDGHVNLSAWFNTSYYREWWSLYPQNFDLRVVQENYLHFNYKQLGPVTFAILPDNVGYMYISDFSSGIGDSNMTAILNEVRLCNGLIIDVRDNGGGSMSNIEPIISRFITERTLVGYMVHKEGPAHDDFSEPHPYYYAPPAGAVVWTKPVVVVTNRSTFSAANSFVTIMKQLPQVTVIGATTGGGSGMPMSYELPVGWGVRMSACPVLDAQGNCTEFGVEPTDGFAVDITEADRQAGRDTILDRAIAFLAGGAVR